MRSRAVIIVIIALSALCGCSHTSNNVGKPSDYLPGKSIPETVVITPQIDLSIEAPSVIKMPPDTLNEQSPPAVYGIDFEDNYKIQQWVTRLTRTNQKYFQENLSRFDSVRPTMEEIFEENGLPIDLVYLCLVESAGKANAVSSAGATGYWQFMSGTARRYGLRINTWVDERRDLEKSTLAAARYLKHLHSIFDDWLLASAAYNAGEGTISRLMDRHPEINTFWDISDTMAIKRETLAYVPKFTASLIIGKNREQFGLSIPDHNRYAEPSYEYVTIHTFTYLDEIAEVIGVPQNDLLRLNTELIRGCTPPNSTEYALKVPLGTADKVKAYLLEIHEPHVEYVTHKIISGDNLYSLAKKYSSSIKGIAQTNRMEADAVLTIGRELIIPRNTVSDKPRGKHTYVVASGDTIKSISLMYGVTVKDIIEVNNLEDPQMIYPDMVLNIPPKPAYVSDRRSTQYRVKKGDTLWAISRQFEVSTHDVIRWNQLPSTAQIFPGDELTIYHR
ncbi:MAG TPA: LysM peptidoglycan-binding domain-containing protein [Deltaproteobacteria bacterium]|nr:LysM peptidoglycan-binding domain-containing protein [Deltaproteobacteria bacterium]